MATASVRGAGTVVLEGITVEAPGIDGQITVERGNVPRRRAATPATRRAAQPLAAGAGARAVPSAPTSESLDRALRRQGMHVNRTISIDGARTTRRGAAPAGPVTIRVPRPRKGRAQVVLSMSGGVVTWHRSLEPQVLPAAEPDRGLPLAGARRGALPATLTYEIPHLGGGPTGAAGTRRDLRAFNPISAIVKVVTFPVAHVVGELARFAARRWDRDNHPPRIRAYNVDGSLTDLADEDWTRLGQGRALLLVHGTFGTSEVFGGLSTETLRMLHDRYGGRVIAYDHPTIADEPSVNAREFFEMVGDHTLDVDCVCHSRGGLVARSIAERPGGLAGLGPNVKVGTIVLVGVLSKGTVLADASHWSELLDRFTTLLYAVPAPGAVAALETVLAVVKSLAVETADDLEGLSAMAPDSDFLKGLNVPFSGSDLAYRAITSNFEPRNPDLRAWLADQACDALFDGAPNDMMVTVDSVVGSNGSSLFPLAADAYREYEPSDGIEHSQYFLQPATWLALEEWLKGGNAPQPAPAPQPEPVLQPA